MRFVRQVQFLLQQLHTPACLRAHFPPTLKLDEISRLIGGVGRLGGGPGHMGWTVPEQVPKLGGFSSEVVLEGK